MVNLVRQVKFLWLLRLVLVKAVGEVIGGEKLAPHVAMGFAV